MELPTEGPTFPEIPEELHEEPKQEMPIIEKIPSEDKFLRADNFKHIASEISSINIDFDNINLEISKTSEIREARNTKTDSLQNTLEEVGKKLMYVEKTLFGG